MYQIAVDGRPVEDARKQLGLKYYHLDFTKTGIQDYILDVYRTRLIFGDISFVDWIETEYWPQPVREGWDARAPSIETAQRLMQHVADDTRPQKYNKTTAEQV